MKQNKYDDPAFFLRYSQMPRSVEGLRAAGEWPVFRNMLPSLENKNVLDLGCGFGWHCRYAREMRAKQVTGVDISEKMIEHARQYTHDPAIRYLVQPIEDIRFPAGAFDVVISSLALHYIENLQTVFQQVFHSLAPGGAFVFSVEHPVFTALATQDWHHDAEGKRLHWPLDNYQQEGIRHTNFLGSEVIKYHRTIATFMNTLIRTGFRITRVEEPQPDAATLAQYPEMKDEARRPIFLLIAAVKEGERV
ncbi:class I SAM-dependent methyltransferase [Chitinophaga vietnamensis]|uniref:class I SAM-dependent methyltransferase n=1 Tax=Chitinophaga vietnamensis TaxID=2593957 RepID=UPI001177C49D|nr:class I SAM-dependent methyltransferase [Chitinophaga vietnamensis]